MENRVKKTSINPSFREQPVGFRTVSRASERYLFKMTIQYSFRFNFSWNFLENIKPRGRCIDLFVAWYGTSLYQTARSVEFSNHREQPSHGQIYMFRYRDVGEKLREREFQYPRVALSSYAIEIKKIGNGNFFLVVATTLLRLLETMIIKIWLGLVPTNIRNLIKFKLIKHAYCAYSFHPLSQE